MRFRRTERHAAPGLTVRKVAAMEQKQKREAAKYPLFAEQITEQQVPTDVATEEQIRRMRYEKSQQSMRDLHARFWRDARRKYYAATPVIRGAIRSEWNHWGGPLEPMYFTYVIEKHTGEAEARMAAIKARDLEIAKQVMDELNRQAALL